MACTFTSFLTLGLISSALAIPTPQSNSSGFTHQILVGKNGLTFTPNSVTAAVGDLVQFSFYSQNHSVVQANFAQPCGTTGGNGFFSGFLNSTEQTQGLQTFTVPITSTNAVYFYCSAPGHCQAGMAGAINPPTSGQQTIGKWIAASQKTSKSTNPPNVQGGKLVKISNAQAANVGFNPNDPQEVTQQQQQQEMQEQRQQAEQQREQTQQEAQQQQQAAQQANEKVNEENGDN
ncbi:MAG: hypothetical protein M1821_001967 [Bathelium mastoideum]|nr:MAG: hypothetical protein M1821_001967 [Bathelium mastoideum]